MMGQVLSLLTEKAARAMIEVLTSERIKAGQSPSLAKARATANVRAAMAEERAARKDPTP